MIMIGWASTCRPHAKAAAVNFEMIFKSKLEEKQLLKMQSMPSLISYVMANTFQQKTLTRCVQPPSILATLLQGNTGTEIQMLPTV